jgi:hypothetical protein
MKVVFASLAYSPYNENRHLQEHKPIHPAGQDLINKNHIDDLNDYATRQKITTKWISMLRQMKQAIRKRKEDVKCQVRRGMWILYGDGQYQ